MSALEGLPPHPAATHDDARVHRIERVLHTYGILTRHTLYDFCGAERWDGGPAFDDVLAEAVRAGRVRSLGGVLFESIEH